MKKFIFTALLVMPVAAMAQQGNFIIQGKLGDVSAAKIYLVNAESKTILDSVTSKNGTFQLKGSIDAITPAFLVLNKEDNGFKQSKVSIFFYLEKGVITVKDTTGQLQKAIIDGTPNNTANLEYNRIDERIEHLSSQIQKKQKTATPERLQSDIFKKEIGQMEKARFEEGKNAYIEFARSHPNADISLMALTELIYVEDQNKVDSLFQNLTTELKNSVKGKKFAAQLAAMQKAAVGSWRRFLPWPIPVVTWSVYRL